MGAIVLTGFMGTGKSEVGRRLATRLGRAFVDTDQLVERDAGKSVAAIFADDGEEAFRARERDAVATAAARRDAVIAVGGGAVLDAANRARLREAGVVVCLTASAETILRRVGETTHRPLLAGGEPRAAIERLLADRRPSYDAAADLTVDTTDRRPEDVVEEICERVGRFERERQQWKSST
jgi:shikimate kinase